MASVVEDMRRQQMLDKAKPQGIMQRAFPNTAMALRERQSDIQSAQNTGGMGAAIGQSFRTAMTPAIGLVDDVSTAAARALNPAAQALKTFATGDAMPIGADKPSPLVNAAIKTPVQAAPQAPMSQTAATMMSGMDQTVSRVPSDPVQPTQIAPGIFRNGNSFSDSQAGADAGAAPAPISAQNMAAADALAARYKTNPLVQASQAPQGPQGFTPEDTGGYGLLDKGRIERRNAMMDAQQMKPGARTALAALLKQQGEVPQQRLAREKMAQDGQESAADRMMRGNELQAKLGESAADRALRSQELADNSLTNAARREAAGLETASERQMADLRNAYLNAKTPEEQAAVAAKINALSGKGQAQDEYMAVGAGETVIDAMGTKVENPDMLVNKRTGLPVQSGQQAQQRAPAVPQAGEVKGGYRFKVGDPSQQSSWEKV